MSFRPHRISAVYHLDLRSSDVGVKSFAPLRDSLSFICISSALSNRSNRGEMHI